MLRPTKQHALHNEDALISKMRLITRKYGNATLAIARLKRVPQEMTYGKAIGTVSLKYVVSPSPIDLIMDLKTFAIRLYSLLSKLIFK